MILQISSGQGPCECELAVKKLYNALSKEFSVTLLESHKSKQKYCDGYTSLSFSTDEDLSFLNGTVEWICKSPYRPNHGRKNWFVDVSVIPNVSSVNASGKIRVEYFHCSGNGGQNVNKVETGVRLIHENTGIIVTATEERSQALNKKVAEEKLALAIQKMKNDALQSHKENAWARHKKIVRGNPVRIYEGVEFKLKK